MKNLLLGILATLTLVSSPVAKAQVITTKLTGTKTVYAHTVWPITKSSTADGAKLSSAFGPRLKASSNFRYDFHSGIDIPKAEGTPVYAIASGTVYNVYSATDKTSPYYGAGGNVVVVKHTLANPITFHGKQLTTFYSHYLHLKNYSVTKGQLVTKGKAIGQVGHTGTTELNHLHFEIRLGTACSREYQTANPTTLCAQTFGSTPQDPHINPLLFLGYTEAGSITATVTQKNPLKIKIASNRAELDFNEIKVSYQNQTKIINFNDRTGLDLNNLDNNNYNGVLISPAKFNSSTAQYEIEFQLAGWTDFSSVEARDIWGNGVKLTQN